MIKTVILLLITISLVCSRTIQWTAAGGNPLWNFANNWDCLCIPTIADDVIINIQNIPGAVTVASPAFANSLIVGGGSSFSQSVIIQSAITLGMGGGKINANGNIMLNSAPSLPFYSAGEFVAGSNLIFISGQLGGQFTFMNVNFSSAAAKQINGTTNISGIMVADIPVGGQGLISIVGGTLTVSGTLKASQTLTISSSTGGKLNIQGTFDYEGVSTTSVTILGTAFISTLNVGGGAVILNDNVNIGLAKVSAGAIISMIGANTVTRVFADVSGTGELDIRGGMNIFHTMSNINTVVLSGGILFADTKQCNILSLTQTGGSINGTATLSASTATFSNAVIVNTPVTISNLDLNGFTTINGGSLTVTVLAVVSQSSQLTLGAGSLFAVSPNARVSQSAPLQLLSSGPAKNTAFKNDGQWTSTSSLTLDIPTSGAGSFGLGAGASIIANGITFSISSILLTSASFTSIGSNIVVGSIDGTGSTITSQSQTFVVTGVMNVLSFVQENGLHSVSTGTIGTLDIQSGTFNVTGTGLKVTSLTFEGGLITSRSQMVNINAGTTLISTNMPKTLSSVTLTSPNINLSCGAAQCELITLSASLKTG